MLSLVCIIGTAPAEAKRNRPGVLPGDPVLRRPKKPKPCNIWTCKKPKPKPCNIWTCNKPPDFGTPIPRPWNKPSPGTQWR